MKPGIETVPKQQAARVAIFVTRLMQSLARVRQNRASETKQALLAGCEHNYTLCHDAKLKSSIQ